MARAYRWTALEGSLIGGTIGGLMGIFLTNRGGTAELGFLLWPAFILTAAAAIASIEEQTILRLVCACVPFVLVLYSVFFWIGAGTQAYFVGRVVFLKGIRVPLAAYTERDLAIRYGLFFLFVLLASPPAVVGFVPSVKGLVRLTRSSFGGVPWREQPETAFRRWLLRLFRIGLVAAVVGLNLVVLTA